jgi:hypothetical protein
MPNKKCDVHGEWNCYKPGCRENDRRTFSDTPTIAIDGYDTVNDYQAEQLEAIAVDVVP